jgi:flagellar hook-associated protein 3 FlgL
MRITNNMMIKNAASNINGNKVNVDSLNSQMTSQKKIQRPSENPVIAIRALRFRSTDSELTQYYENNIEDAEGWLETTETALTNMYNVLKDIRYDCEYGATDTLTADDRNTILSDLKKLREQVYAEGNTDYAGRTVFTGYRTNQTLTFLADSNDTYEITESLSYKDIETQRYYAGDIDSAYSALGASAFSGSPAAAATATLTDPTEMTYNRIRLSYTLDGDNDSIISAQTGSTAQPVVAGYSYTAPSGTTIDPALQSSSLSNDKTAYPYGLFLSYTPADTGTSIFSAASADTSVPFPVLVYDTMDSAMADADTDTGEIAFPQSSFTYTSGTGNSVTSYGAIFIEETGELILSNELSEEMSTAQATLDITYDKTGFDVGELKPEYYFNCTKTSTTPEVTYTKYDDAGNQVYQDINYVVAGNQTLGVNVEGSSVMSADIGRDVDEMIEAMQRAIDANDMVTQLDNMAKDSSTYSADTVEKWLAAAEKEADYANANLQKLYNSYMGNFDTYMQKVQTAITDVGSKGVSLSLTKNRVSNQLTTVEELMSKNEDRDLSDIILDYTSAYTAYQASLQAGATLGQTTLLDYL